MNQQISSYRDLMVWQKSMDVVVKTYRLTEKFPNSEQFGLISQIRRAAVSIPSNIAEGSRRNSNKDRGRFLSIAFGSGSELETQIEICKRLNYGQNEECDQVQGLLVEVQKMLNKMLENLGVY